MSAAPELHPHYAPEVLQAAYPLVLAGQPQRVLVLGGTSRTVLRTCLEFPLTELTCVEGDPALAELSRGQWATLTGFHPEADDRFRWKTACPNCSSRSGAATTTSSFPVRRHRWPTAGPPVLHANTTGTWRSACTPTASSASGWKESTTDRGRCRRSPGPCSKRFAKSSCSSQRRANTCWSRRTAPRDWCGNRCGTGWKRRRSFASSAGAAGTGRCSPACRRSTARPCKRLWPIAGRETIPRRTAGWPGRPPAR